MLNDWNRPSICRDLSGQWNSLPQEHIVIFRWTSFIQAKAIRSTASWPMCWQKRQDTAHHASRILCSKKRSHFEGRLLLRSLAFLLTRSRSLRAFRRAQLPRRNLKVLPQGRRRSLKTDFSVCAPETRSRIKFWKSARSRKALDLPVQVGG